MPRIWKKVKVNMPPSKEENVDLIQMLDRHYENTGLSEIKVAVKELKRLYALFEIEPPELEQYKPDVVIRMGLVMKLGCKYFNVDQQGLLAHTRLIRYRIPRRIIMYLGRELTNLSCEQLGRWFDRDHTTIVDAYQVVSEKIKSQPIIKQYVDDITVACQRAALEEHKRTQEMIRCQQPIEVAVRPIPKANLPKPTPQPIRLSMDV